MQLDEHQMRAVKHFEGPAVVIAGPGSGKTTVIKERILHLIREYNVTPKKILAVAFTRAAAKEMEQRLLPELRRLDPYPGKPEIRTLHAFGLQIIRQHYRKLGLSNRPNVWKSFELEQTIKEEVARLKREKANASVTIYIYKIGSKITDKCYIGQTTDPERRKEEHFADSSNIDLNQAILTEGRENFTFEVIEEVEGRFADHREAKWIERYKNLAVFNSEYDRENIQIQIENETANSSVTIFKIESNVTGKCYIGQTTDPEWTKDNFMYLSNNALHRSIEDEGSEQFAFKVIQENIPAAEATQYVAQEIEICKNRAVFNQNNPLTQPYSDRLLIELFCQHFNICYEDLLKRPSDIKNFAEKIEDFEKIANDVEKAKRQVGSDFFSANSIDDIVNSIVNSIEDLVVRAFAEKYEKKKKEANAVDFQDMIIYSAYLLRTFPNLRKQYLDKYSYVLVDEFQDISPIDFRLIELLPENLFTVGDDDQAIYSFRGGDSEIMQNFHKREDVKEYKITRNFRSTLTIVEHSKALIEYNQDRIPKNLRANSEIQVPIKVLETTEETAKSAFLKEFVEPFCQTQFIDNRIPILENTMIEVSMEMQTIGIPVRYRSEVEKIRKILLDRGFKKVNINRKVGDPFKAIGRSRKEIIEVSTIHSMKGKEYDRVILIHNTLGKDFPFHHTDNMSEERRAFYVAMTRAKKELVVIGGGCQFVSELRLENLYLSLISAIENRVNYEEKQLEEVSKSLLEALTYEKQRQIKILVEKLKKQNEPKLNRLRHKTNEAENARKNIEKKSSLRLAIRKTFFKETLLKELIPVLDNLEVIVNSNGEKVGTNNDPTELVSFCEKIRFTQKQFLDSLKIHAFTQVKCLGQSFDPDQHEEIQPGIFTDEVPKGIVAEELQRGYILNNRVIRKAKVVVSNGQWDAYGIFMDLEKPVCLVTDQKIHFFEKVMILAESIKGVDLQGSEVRIRKPDVMFAYPKTDKETVTQQCQPVEEILDSNSISEDFLKSVIVRGELTNVKKQRFYLNVVTRSGYVLRGYLRAFDKNALCMWINEQFVVVYRHALLKIEHVDLKNPPVKKDFRDFFLGFRDFIKRYFNWK